MLYKVVIASVIVVDLDFLFLVGQAGPCIAHEVIYLIDNMVVVLLD